MFYFLCQQAYSSPSQYSPICPFFLSKNWKNKRRKKDLVIGWRQFIFISLHLVGRELGGRLGSIITDSVAMETDLAAVELDSCRTSAPRPIIKRNLISSLLATFIWLWVLLAYTFSLGTVFVHKFYATASHCTHRVWTPGVLTSLPRKHETEHPAEDPHWFPFRMEMNINSL